MAAIEREVVAGLEARPRAMAFIQLRKRQSQAIQIERGNQRCPVTTVRLMTYDAQGWPEVCWIGNLSDDERRELISALGGRP
jgi:hypothetical protein